MALTDTQKTRIAYHLGYPLITAGAGAGMALPTMVQVLFPVYGPLNHLEPTGEASITTLISNCDAAETQMLDAQSRMKVTGVGSISLRADEFQSLNAAYAEWRRRLSQATSIPINVTPSGSGGGVVVRRVH